MGENTEKYISISVPIKKEHNKGKTTIYKVKVIDSYRFMQNSLPSLVDNLSEINNKEPENKFTDNNKIDLINKTDEILSEVNTKVTNKVKSIYKAMRKLKDEIYNDPWLRLIELNKMNIILDDALYLKRSM